MYRRARIYWLAWALLVTGAAATRIASVQDAFFQGAIAAFLAPLALPLYEKAGVRLAAFLGALTGIFWVFLLNEGWGHFMWDEPERALASARFDVQISVAVAAFAGTALAGAMVHRVTLFPRAAIFGGGLALVMTAVPYAVIHQVEEQRKGPIEITWFAGAKNFNEQGRPIRPIGTLAPKITPEDIAYLRTDYLTIDVGGETALIDTSGQRLWAVWRKRLTQSGHENGPVRRVFIVNTCAEDNPNEAFLQRGLRLTEDPKGACLIQLKNKDGAVFTGKIDFLPDSAESEFGVLLKFATYPCEKLSTTNSDFIDPVQLQPSLTNDNTRPKCHALWAVRRGLLESESSALARSIPRSEILFNFSMTVPDLVARVTPTQPKVPAGAPLAEKIVTPNEDPSKGR